jgi:hypothetical protein
MKNIYTTLMGLISIILISCSSEIAPIANTPQKLWDKSIALNEKNSLESILLTSDNYFTFIGSSSNVSTNTSSITNQNIDFWMSKVNGFGKMIWEKTYGGNNNEYIQSSIKTSDDGFVMVGYTNSNKSGDKTENSRGNIDFWIVKVDSNGQKIWDKTFGGNNNDIASSITDTGDGGFIVAGNSDSGISGDKTESSRGSQDFWIIKINSKGEKIWDKTIGGNQIDEVNSVVSDFNGNFVILGSSSSEISGDKTTPAFGNSDFWLVKIDANGRKIWDKVCGGNDFEKPFGITSAKDGSIIVTGLSFSQISGNKTARNKGKSDFWVLKVNSLGEILWDRTFGGDVFNFPQSIVSTTTGDVVISGTSLSDISGDKSEKNRGESDFWIVKIDTNGKKLWDKTLGGSKSDYPRSMSYTPDGKLLICGFSESGISGDKTAKTLAKKDLWILKLGFQ